MRGYGGGYKWEVLGVGRDAPSASDAVQEKQCVRAHQAQETKSKNGPKDDGAQDTNCAHDLSGSGLSTS